MKLPRLGNRPEHEAQPQKVTLLRNRRGVMVGSRFRVTGIFGYHHTGHAGA